MTDSDSDDDISAVVSRYTFITIINRHDNIVKLQWTVSDDSFGTYFDSNPIQSLCEVTMSRDNVPFL